MAQTRRRWLRWLAKAVLVTAAVLAALAAAGKWWIGPAVVRWRINRVLPKYWDGSAEIGPVDLGFFGPTIIEDVILHDRQGRTWLRARKVAVSLGDWPGLNPVVRRLKVYRPELTAHGEGGQWRPPPLRLPDDGCAGRLDLVEARMFHTTLTVVNDGNTAGQWSVPAVLFERNGGLARLTINGADFGPVTLTDIKAEGFVMANERIELARLTGRLGGGRIVISGHAENDASGRWRAAGRVVAARVDLACLRLAISGGEKGVVTGMADFRLDSPDANGLTGKGMALIKGADLSGAPMAAALLKNAGLDESEMLGQADGDCLFHFRGATLTLDQARLRLPLAAVDVEPGATINAWTGQIDALAVVVLFERVRDSLKNLPIVGLMVDLTEQFSRFRMRGLWQDEDSIRITPAAIGDVTSRTREFLTDAARGRKRLGRGILDVLGMANGNSATPARPASGPSTIPATRPSDRPGK